MIKKPLRRILSFYPYGIAVLVVILCLAVWPLGLLGHTTYQSSSLERGIFPNINLADGSLAMGAFTPTRSRLDSLSFQFLTSGKAPEGTVTLELYNSLNTEITSITLVSGDIMNYRWIKFPLEKGIELEPGQLYRWQMRAFDYEEATLALYCGSPIIGPEESESFYYNGNYEEKLLPAMIYTYTDKIDREHLLPYASVFLILGLLLFPVCEKFKRTNEDF